MSLRLGVIGAGFVGDAVIAGFDRPNVDMWIVDPKFYKTTISELVDAAPHMIFVCVPTPGADDGSVDVSTVDTVLKEISSCGYTDIVVIKSTITPDHLQNLQSKYFLRLVYNPEFLTEANARHDFVNPSMQILGGQWHDCETVERAYVKYSSVKIVPTFKTDLITASMLKYTINSWLATKVSFMNELYQLHKDSGATSTWQQFTDMLQRDTRVGSSHLQVPGPDGEFGFGGHCFPKDTAAFINYAHTQNKNLSVLQTAVDINNKIRASR
jgi:UDPglucose 6-dehydrogenase